MERVLCFSKFLLEDIYGEFDGISFDIDNYSHLIMAPNNHIFVERDRAENSFIYKQIIPYIILINSQGDIFNYCRGQKGGEKRLQGGFSIGIGGHLNEDDYISDKNKNGYLNGIQRELLEEVDLSIDFARIKMKGFLNISQTAVDRVHFGVIHMVKLEEQELGNKEHGVIECGAFSSKENILQDFNYYESWSQMCLINWEKLI